MQIPKSIEKAVEVLVCAAPVFKREFIGILRSRMGFWVAVGTVAVTGLVPLVAWPSESGPGSDRIDGEICVMPLWSILVLMSVARAVSMQSEYGKMHMEGLLVTRLPTASILFGIHLASAAYAALVVVLCLPLTVFYLLSARPIGPFLLVEILAVSLINSFIPADFTGQKQGLRETGVTTAWFRFLYSAPLAVYVFVLWSYRSVSAPARYSVYALSLSLHVLIGFWSLQRTDGRLLLQRPKKLAGLAGLIQSLPVEHRQRWLKTASLTFPDGVNPVFRLTHGPKHASLKQASPQDYRLTLLLGLFVLGVIASTWVLGVTLYAVTGSLLLVSVAGSAATTALLVRAESDQETLENLRATPLSVFEILWGKLAGAFWMPPWRYFYLSAAGVMAVAAVLLPIETHHRVFTFLFIPALAVVAALGSTAGLLGAALSRDTVQAVILAFAVFLAPLLVVPLLLGPMEPVSRSMSPLVGYYAAVHEFRTSKVFSPGALLLSLPLGLSLAGLQFFLAVRISERKWMRGG